MFILAENWIPYEFKKYQSIDVLDCNTLQELILKDFHIPELNTPTNPVSNIREWIFFVLLLGSDFNPGVFNNNNTMRKIVSEWKILFASKGLYITSKKGDIDIDVALQLLNSLQIPNNFSKKKKEKMEKETKEQHVKYNLENFGILEDDTGIGRVVFEYFKVLTWTLKTYIYECPSWTYYYPYTKSPKLIDFKHIEKDNIQFNLGKPLLPLSHLVSNVLKDSADLVPDVLHNMMLDSKSSILDFSEDNLFTGKLQFL